MFFAHCFIKLKVNKTFIFIRITFVLQNNTSKPMKKDKIYDSPSTVGDKKTKITNPHWIYH